MTGFAGTLPPVLEAPEPPSERRLPRAARYALTVLDNRTGSTPPRP
jgi:hypothetical protein